VPAQHLGLIGQRQADPGQALQDRGVVPAGQVGTADRPGEQQVAAEQRARLVGGRQPEGHRAGGVPGRVVHGDLDPGQVEHGPVGQFPDVVGLAEGDPAEQPLARLQREPAARVGQQRPVVRVNVGRDVPGPAHRGHGPDVIDVAVREQDRGRLQPEPLDRLLDALLRVLAGIDDQALLPRRGRHQVTVRGERAGRKPGDKHG